MRQRIVNNIIEHWHITTQDWFVEIGGDTDCFDQPLWDRLESFDYLEEEEAEIELEQQADIYSSHWVFDTQDPIDSLNFYTEINHTLRYNHLVFIPIPTTDWFIDNNIYSICVLPCDHWNYCFNTEGAAAA